MLEITTEVLESTFYELHLTAKATPPEKTTHIKSILGNWIDFRLQLKNFSKRPCEFDIKVIQHIKRELQKKRVLFTNNKNYPLKVDKTVFSSPKYIAIPPNQSSMIKVRFEPDCLETINATITATSPTAGEFV